MLITEKEAALNYEEAMLLQNRIPGLLPCGSYREDGNVVYRYDITGKQTLEVKTESGQIEELLLIQLLTGLCGVMEQMDCYLLDTEKLLLFPECIFWDNETERVWFCYNPQTEQSMSDMFRKLLEYLLPKIDHTDEKAVELAYTIYEETLRDGYSLEGIRKRLIQRSEDVEKEKEAETEKPDKTERPQKLEKSEEIISDRQSVAVHGVRGSEKCKNLSVNGFATNFLEKARGILAKTFRLQLDRERKNPKKADFRKPMFLRKSEPVESEFLFEPGEEEIKQGRPTVLLAEGKMEPRGILKYEGTHHLQDLEITQEPYLIGSDAGCDGRIDSPTISRAHARITRTEGIYFIEDLNSANGTVVGGKLLNYKMKVSIEENEIIEFADEKFRFI